GVQKLGSAIISPTKRKRGEAIFVLLFLLLDAGQLFHNLFFKRCLKFSTFYYLVLFRLSFLDNPTI
ncbi:hypothetical protein KYX90_00880, partial [Enterococcus lactis]|uniref:hypothetical protein n=1 Tax=Enterococcus lactis TaxID=357441 RepID=UPI001C7D0F05